MRTGNLLSILCLLLAGALAAEEADSLKGYGNTPEDLRPYHNFVQQPYKQFFLEPLAFTGPGRDQAEPQVDSVKIGVLAPLERSYETYIGRPMLDGIQIAIDEANAQGGYQGKPFALVVHNDTGLWGASANEIARFTYQDSAWAVIGTVDGANTHIAIRVALKTEIPVMNVADTDPTLVETRIPWIFRDIADDRQMTYTIAYYAFKEMNYQKVAILRANNRYGRFGVSEFRSAAVRLGRPTPIEINYETNYDQVNPEFKVQLERLKKVKPDAVVLWADAEAAGELVKRIREAGLKMPLLACDRVVNPRFLQLAGPAAEGVIATSPYNPDADSPALKHFAAAYHQRTGADPGVYAAHAYDGTWMVIEAIRKAGLNRYRIRDALAETKSYQGVTGLIEMDDAYSDRGPVTMATVRQGRFAFGLPEVKARF
ncbi:MAG: ABC transporter substrate-binding protein [Candidatus Latescibacteria bacterium]|nr:ABC transporter substrate-binding protein [Candidatus Latescibacterota bacterium]